MNRSDVPLTVLMMPDCRDANPYQSLLETAISSQGAIVHFNQGYRRVLPLFRAVQHQPVDVLHLHWIVPYLRGKTGFTQLFYCIKFLIDLRLVKATGTKIVWTIHNRIGHESRFPRLELWVRSQLAKLADELILHNRSTQAELAQAFRFPLDKATVIPHGHYRDVYSAQIPSIEARQALNLPTTGMLFLSLGMLRPYKGIETLIETWANHQAAFSDCTLLIAGQASPAYAETLQHKIADLPNVLLIPEFIPNDRIHLFFSAASIVVLPYQRILNSGSLILAMSYGLPVIAPNLGSIAEYLMPAIDLVFDPEDEQGLIKSMLLATQIDLETLRQETSRACDRLDWSKIGQETTALYQARSTKASTVEFSAKRI